MYGYAKHLNFDPSDRAYVLDSGFRRNDGVGIEASTLDLTFLKVLLITQHYPAPTTSVNARCHGTAIPA